MIKLQAALERAGATIAGPFGNEAEAQAAVAVERFGCALCMGISLAGDCPATVCD